MSIHSTTATAIETKQEKVHSAKPSFFGIVRGEFFKISRRWTTWIMLVLLAGVITLPYLITFTVSNAKDDIDQTPMHFFDNHVGSSLGILRVFVGIFLIIITAVMIGQEYQFGTIRILLARGVGRLQLLFAKVLTITCIGLVVLGAGLLLNVLLLYATVFLISGNVNAFNAWTPAFWADTRLYIVTILISMGVTILMAVAISVIGRSLSFALSAALAFFPVDNFGTIFLYLGNRLTHSDFWLNLSAYLLGPNLNTMPKAVVSTAAFTIGLQPFVKVDGSHTLWVTVVYAIIFAVVALVLTWRRDVKE